MAVQINDQDLAEKIAQVEGEDWLKHHKLWEDKQGGSDDFTIACARRMYAASPNYVYSIYGAGGWHRYFTRKSGEVVFSVYHSALQYPESLSAKELLEKVRKAGFRTSEEA